MFPDLEPEGTFSYAEIAAQLECETYLAAIKIEIDNKVDPNTKKIINTAFDTWDMDILINPNQSYDGALNIGFTSKSSATAKNYFQLGLGGGSSPGGAGYDMYGATNARNEYVFPVLKLFKTENGKISDWKFSDGKHTFMLHQINKSLWKICRPSTSMTMDRIVPAMVQDAAHHDIPAGGIINNPGVPNIRNSKGFFGIYDFLDRSFAVNNTLGVLPKSILYTKEYKVKINVGATPGWYVATGNTSPGVGALRTIDNTVTVSFAPDPLKSGATHQVAVVKTERTSSGKLKTRTVIEHRPSTYNGVSPAASEVLSNSISNSVIQQLQNKLNQQ